MKNEAGKQLRHLASIASTSAQEHSFAPWTPLEREEQEGVGEGVQQSSSSWV